MIYLDNSATTRPYPEVCQRMAKVAYEQFGNPSSLHHLGVLAERELRAARQTVAAALQVREDEIIFTSGGSESANLAILGVTGLHRGRHIITTRLEHPCVREPIAYLEQRGWRVTFLPVDANGMISLSDLEEALCDDTALVCLMHVNNEIGTIAPIEAIGKKIREKAPRAVFFCDGVQSFGKLPLSGAWCDLISLSGHKIHGPKGIGALYVRKGIRLQPHIRGGGQEQNRRSGTENLPGIVGLAEAINGTLPAREERAQQVSLLKQQLCEGICKRLENVRVHQGDFANSSPYILHLAFPGLRAETLIHCLEEKGIYVSAGSACSSNKPGISSVLKAIGCGQEEWTSSVRFSLSGENTEEEIEQTIEALAEIVPKLRQIGRR